MTGSRYEPGNAGGRDHAGVEAPLRPVLSGRRGVRQRLGLVVVAAVAITVLAAGIGLGESGLLPAPSASGGSPGPSSSGVKGSPTPAAPTPERTALNSSGCFPVDPANVPKFRLAASTIPGLAVNGIAGPPLGGPPDETPGAPQTSRWPVPSPASGLVLPSTAAIVITPEDDACIRYAVAEYIAIADIGEEPTALGPGETNVFPPQPRVELGGVPIGDYVVRVVVYYSTGVAGNEDKAVDERFFRVTTDVNPAVSPDVTPAVPCGTPDPRIGVGLFLQLGDGEPVQGVNLDTYSGDITKTGALVEGPLSDPLILSMQGDVCATSWVVEWLDSSGSAMFEVRQDNRTQNPYLVSQNRIVLEPEQDVFGHIAVRATVELGLGHTVQAAWELERAGPPLPKLEFSGPDGQTVVGIPGCGAGWNTADGRSLYEWCESQPIPEAVRLLTIRSGDIVTILEPEGTIDTWSVYCGTRGGSDGSEFANQNCDLGGGPSAPMRFLPFPGRWMIQAYLSVTKDGETYYAPWFVEILVED